MARNIIIVNATQVVTSESHPEGLLSTVTGFPITFDSVNYNNDVELTMKKAKATYYKQLGTNYEDVNSTRVMKTVTLEMASGQQILHESIGWFPETTEEPAE